MNNIKEFDFEAFQGPNPFNCMAIASIMSGKTHYVLNILWPEISWRFPDISTKKESFAKEGFKSIKRSIIDTCSNLWNGNKKEDKKETDDSSTCEIVEPTTVYVVTTEYNVNQYKRAIPHCMISTDKNQFSSLIKTIQTIQNQNIVGTNREGINLFKYEVLLIIDDSSTDDIIKSESMEILYTQMRHLMVSVVFCVQYPQKIVTPLMKTNTTIFLIGKLNDRFARSSIRPIIESGLENLGYAKLSDERLKSLADDCYVENVMKQRYRMLVLCISSEGFIMSITGKITDEKK